MLEVILNVVKDVVEGLDWSHIVTAVIGYIVIRITIDLGARVKRWLERKIRQWQLSRAHPVQSTHTNVCLTLLEKDGRRAHYSKSSSFAFTRPTQSYVEILYSEGRIENVLCNAGLIKPERIDFGHKHYRVEFPTTYQSGAQDDVVFSADLLDAFTGETEWWTHVVLYRTEKLIIRIVPPSERPITRFAVQKRDGNQWHVLNDQGRLVREGMITVVQVIMDAVEIGDLYKVEWSW